MSFRSNHYSEQSSQLMRSTKSQKQLQRSSRIPAHMLATDFHGKGKMNNSYLQQEYYALKDKLRCVQEKNQLILKKIKDNMIAVYESEEDTLFDQHDPRMIKLTMPQSMQRTKISTDSHNFSSSYQDIFYEQSIHLPPEQEECLYVPVIQNYANRFVNNMDLSLYQAIQIQIGGVDSAIRSKMDQIINKIMRMETQFAIVDQQMNGVKKKISIKSSLRSDSDAMSRVKSRQREMLLEDYKKKINKLTQEIINHEQKATNYEKAIEEKNHTLYEQERTIKEIRKEYQQYKGQADVQKLKLSQKFIEVTNTKNCEITKLEKKLSEIISTSSEQSKTPMPVNKKDESVKTELWMKKKQIQKLIEDLEKFKVRSKSLELTIQAKNSELKTVSYQLMETQMMSTKVKQMFEEMKTDHQNLEKEKLRKESELMENFKDLKEGSKKKLRDLNEKVNTINEAVNELSEKIPRKLRRSLEGSNYEEILKTAAVAFDYYEKRQSSLHQNLMRCLNISSTQLEVSGLDEILERIGQQLKRKDTKIKQLEGTQRSLTPRNLKSKRQVSPFSTMRNSQHTSPANQCNCLVYQSEIKQRKRQISNMKQQIGKKQGQNGHLVRKIQLMGSQIQQLKNRIDKLSKEGKQLSHENQKLISEKDQGRKQEKQQLNKVASTNKLMETANSQLSQKNRELIRQIQSLNKKIKSIETNMAQNLVRLKRIKQEKNSIEKELKQKLQEKKQAMQRLIEQRNLLKVELKVTKSKLEIKNVLQSQKDSGSADNQHNQQTRGRTEKVVQELRQTLEQKQRFIKDIETKNKIKSQKQIKVEQDLKASLSVSKVFETKKSIEFDQMKKQIQRLTAVYGVEKEKYQLQKNKLSEKLKSLEKAFRQKDQETNTLKKQITQCKNKEKSLREQLSNKDHEISNQLSENKILRDKLNEASKINGQILKINLAKQAQLSESEQEYQLRVSSLQRQITNGKDQVKKKDILLQELRQELRTCKQSFSSTRELYRSYKEKVQNDLNEKQQLLQDRDSLQKNYLARVHKLETDNLQHLSQLTGKQKSYANLLMKVQEKTLHIEKLQSTLQGKQNEIFQLIQKINDLKYSLMDDLDNKSEYIRQIRTDNDIEIETLKERLEITEKQLLQLQRQILQLSSKYNQIVEGQTKEAETLRKTQAERLESTIRLQNLKAKLSEMQAQHQQIQTHNERLAYENQSLIKNVKQLDRQMKEDQERKKQFIGQIDNQHQNEIRVLQARIKRQQNQLKIAQQTLLEKEKQLNKRDIECQIIEQRLTSQLKWKHAIETELDSKNHQLELIKVKFQQQSCESKLRRTNGSIINAKSSGNVYSGQRLNFHHRIFDIIVARGDGIRLEMDIQSTITPQYIRKFRAEFMMILSRQKCEFSQSFINLHKADTAYQLSVFKSELVKNNIRNSILQELEFADKHGLDFVSRLDDQLDEVVNGLQKQNNEHVSRNQIEHLRGMINSYEIKMKEMESYKDKDASDSKKIHQFFTRQINTIRKNNDGLTQGLLSMEKNLKRVLEIVFGQENKVLQLKQTFERIQNTYQDLIGESNIDFNKFREAYFSKANDQERSRSKRKGWLNLPNF